MVLSCLSYTGIRDLPINGNETITKPHIIDYTAITIHPRQCPKGKSSQSCISFIALIELIIVFGVGVASWDLYSKFHSAIQYLLRPTPYMSIFVFFYLGFLIYCGCTASNHNHADSLSYVPVKYKTLIVLFPCALVFSILNFIFGFNSPGDRYQLDYALMWICPIVMCTHFIVSHHYIEYDMWKFTTAFAAIFAFVAIIASVAWDMNHDLFPWVAVPGIALGNTILFLIVTPFTTLVVAYISQKSYERGMRGVKPYKEIIPEIKSVESNPLTTGLDVENVSIIKNAKLDSTV
jgi:hypothetical protein